MNLTKKEPRKGTVAWHAAQKRKEQEKDPAFIKKIEKLGNKDHMIGKAKVIHDDEIAESLSESTILAINNLLAEGKMSQYLPPFKANGLCVDDARGNSVLEANDHGTPKEIAAALNAFFGKKTVKEASDLNDVSIGSMRDKKSIRDASDAEEGDAVEITGHVNFKGDKGTIERFGQDKRFVVVKLKDGDSHAFHTSDVTPIDDDGDDEDDDEDQETFYVAFYDEDEHQSWIGKVSKADGGKWHESAFKGKPDYRWGQSYMSYLSPEDIMRWINKDYGRNMEIEGPYFNPREAEEHVKHNWGSIQEGVKASGFVKAFAKTNLDMTKMLKKKLQDKKQHIKDIELKITDLAGEKKGITDLEKTLASLQKEIDSINKKLKESVDISEAESYTDFEDWKQAVLNSYPAQAKKIKFKGRMEGNKDTISAEVPGEDRSYGVWDQDEEKGVVLSEDDKPKKKQELVFRKSDLKKAHTCFNDNGDADMDYEDIINLLTDEGFSEEIANEVALNAGRVAPKKKMTESKKTPNIDQILEHLTSAFLSLKKHRDDYTDFSVIERVYDALRSELKNGDYEGFSKEYDRVLAKYPDAAGELIDAMFGAAGLKHDATIDQFLSQVSESAIMESSKDMIEAYGIKGMKRTPWRRTFKNADALVDWCEKMDAEVYGQRETDYAVQLNKNSEHAGGKVEEAAKAPTEKQVQAAKDAYESFGLKIENAKKKANYARGTGVVGDLQRKKGEAYAKYMELKKAFDASKASVEEGVVDSVKGFVKHQSNMAKANNRGWKAFGKGVQAALADRYETDPEENAKNEKTVKQSVRDANRYRDFSHGGKGFNSTKRTTAEKEWDDMVDGVKGKVKGAVDSVKKVFTKEGISPFKPGAKVKIIGGPKDCIGKDGEIGEVKTEGGKKTFVVDYDHDYKSDKPNFGCRSVSLSSKDIRLVRTVKEEKKGDGEQLEVINKAHADNGAPKKVFFTGNREECYDFMRKHKSLKMDLMYKDSGRLASYVL